MELVPLIPKIKSETCADTSYILREEFQELLGHDQFQKNIAENLAEFNSREKLLKICGTEVVQSYTESKIYSENLTYAEKCVMTAQAQGLVQEPKTVNLFKLEKIYPDVNKDVVEKYSLIQYQDIMPHITERIINCKMKPEEFIFKNMCPEMKKTALLPIRCQGKCDPKDVYDLKITPSTESTVRKHNNYQLRREQFNRKMRHKYSFTNRQVFLAEPNYLAFVNFEQNVVYTKKFRIKNITPVLQQFKPPFVSPDSCYTVTHTSGNMKLACGLCADFTVTFQALEMTDSYSDVVTIPVIGSQDVIVQLCSSREAPVMKALVYSDDYKELEMNTPRDKDDVFNYTIDCGAVLYGCSREMKFIVTNCGGNGTFFFISEEDWIFGEVNVSIRNISEDYTLHLSDFSLTPAYFELKENELFEITINFKPTQYGLCLDKMYLLCNSNTVEEIDIIGDCVFYETYFLKFQMPDCPYPPVFRKLKDPHNVVHLGAIHSMQNVSGSFKVKNTSTVQMCYQWQKNTCVTKKKGFIPIEEQNIEIKPQEGMFLPATETEFFVTVHMGATDYGLYRFEFSLYLLDILEDNLSDGYFNFGQEYLNENSEKTLTIQVDRIEVQIHHIALRIQLYPEILSFPTLYYKQTSKEKTVRIKNEGYNCFVCEWIVCKCKNGFGEIVSIQPEKFQLEENACVECTVTVTPDSYDDLDERVVLSINKGYSARTLSLHAYVEKPHIQISNTFINFGVVHRKSTVSTQLIIENHTDAELYWRVHEYRYELNSGKFHETCPAAVNSDCGVLCHSGSGTHLKYTLDTSEPKKFIAILVFCTIYKERSYESCHVILTAHIAEPIVFILTENYKEDIFDENEEYFVGESVEKTFYIHNDSPLEVRYMWNEPDHFDDSLISLCFDCTSGRLYPFSRRSVVLTMKLLNVGSVYSVYHLCVEALRDHLQLQIVFKIKPQQVEFFLPQPRTTVLWPSYDFDMSTHEGDLEEFDTRDNCTDIQFHPIPYQRSHSFLHCYPSDLYTYLRNIECMGEVSYHYPSEITAESVDDISTRHTPQFLSVFGSNTSICEYYIEFKNLKCRLVHKVSFDITNFMDLPLQFAIKLKNFEQKPLNFEKLHNVLINLNMIPDDKYTEQLSPYGIFVNIEPKSGVILNKSTISIEIQVYAETWGLYLEEISIELENLPTFYINCIIQITDFPVHFPIYEKYDQVSTNTLKFGNIEVCSQPVTRTIYIKNICTIPYKIVWHVFVKDVEDYFKSGINIAYDIFGFNTTECKLKILNYYGKEICEKFNLFKIEPAELDIEPQELKSINVTLCPQNVDNSNIEALLVGHLYIEEQYSKIKNNSTFVFRWPDKDLLPIKFKLSASIEPTEIDLNCISGEQHIKLHVSEFMKDNREVENTLRLIFRNTNKFPIIMGLKIDEPFSILSVKSANCETTTPDQNEMYTSVVDINSCAQVFIRCHISTKLLVQMADILYRQIPHELEDATIFVDNKIKIIKKLYIYQKCNISQQLSISVHLTFPLTEITPEKLQFGEVRLGTEKRLYLTLRNKTTSETWFNAKCDMKHVFHVEPAKGFIEPMQPHDHSALIIITFTPKDIGYWEDTVTITTCVSHYTQEINVSGYGTFNEFNFCDVAPTK